MIPKIIHYCWFGEQELPESVKDCMESWRRFFPDFEIKCWDETNFDISRFVFAEQAYTLGKYAFVADVCRAYALYSEGGLYFDTDMLFIKPLSNEIVNLKAFIGWENNFEVNAAIVGSEKAGVFITDLIETYKKLTFNTSNNQVSANLVIPFIITQILRDKGIIINGEYQCIDNYISIYPKNHFYPKDYKTGYTTIDKDTVAIHLYDATWHSAEQQLASQKSQLEMRLFYAIRDLKVYFSVGDILSMCYRALNKNPFHLFTAIFSKLVSIVQNKVKGSK